MIARAQHLFWEDIYNLSFGVPERNGPSTRYDGPRQNFSKVLSKLSTRVIATMTLAVIFLQLTGTKKNHQWATYFTQTHNSFSVIGVLRCV